MVDIDKYRIGKVFIVITSLTNLVRYLKEYVTMKNGGISVFPICALFVTLICMMTIFKSCKNL